MNKPLRAAALVAAAFLALPVHAQRAVLLVRHAELEGHVMAQPAYTPLSEVGEARAQRLGQMLKTAGITAIYTSEFLRTRQTAEPLVHSLRIHPVVVPKAETQTLADRMRREQPDGVVLVVGHSDTLPGLLKSLGQSGEVKVESADYGTLYVWTPGNGDRPLAMRY